MLLYWKLVTCCSCAVHMLFMCCSRAVHMLFTGSNRSFTIIWSIRITTLSWILVEDMGESVCTNTSICIIPALKHPPGLCFVYSPVCPDVAWATVLLLGRLKSINFTWLPVGFGHENHSERMCFFVLTILQVGKRWTKVKTSAVAYSPSISAFFKVWTTHIADDIKITTLHKVTTLTHLNPP